MDIGRPVEGSLFDWLDTNGVACDILGEGLAFARDHPAAATPSTSTTRAAVQNITYTDIEKACYTAGRVRVACDLGPFIYKTLPNDHTIGVAPDASPRPRPCAR